MGNNRYFITGGGTGGHIYPAVAVADKLLELHQEAKIYYIGNPNNLEADIVKDKNYTFLPVNSFGMPRKACLKLLFWTWQMFLGWLKCCFYIKKYEPDVVFGTGGYVSAPMLFAAITMKVPFVMHDCDANPGLVTRKLAPFAKSVSCAFEIARNKLNNKNCIVNGNPIRKDFSMLSKSQARQRLNLEDKLTICIMGGSQGAQKINSAAVKILQRLTNGLNTQVIFQTGKKNFELVLEELKLIYPDFEADKNLIVRPYFDNMAEVLKSSDIAVTRAGSLSISEICASSVAPIFIPYAYAAADHQRKNAQFMVKNGAGLYLEDDDTTAEKLFELINSLVKNSEQLNNIQKAVNKFAIFDGAERIANLIDKSFQKL